MVVVPVFWIFEPTVVGQEVELPQRLADQPEELGVIAWERDFEQALHRAQAEDRPVLVLFDEVPGCQTVVSFGRRVLSHPLIAEAAETLFVPVAVYNNVGGKDREVLSSFGEPSWNNPVVRIVDPERKALAPRHDGDYTLPGMAANMIEALRTQEREVPTYLRLLAQDAGVTEQATFAMYCFWTGEAAVGGLEGVRATRAAFLDGHEVVDVEFDPNVTPFDELLKTARSARCADRVYARTPGQRTAAETLSIPVESTSDESRVSEKDTKYQLRHSPLRFVPMTEAQASRVNAALGHRRDSPSPSSRPGSGPWPR